LEYDNMTVRCFSSYLVL